MAQTDELGLAMLVMKTVKQTEFDDSKGLVRIVLTFDDESQLMVYGEGLSYSYREKNADPLLSYDQLVEIMRHQRDSM